MAWSAGWAAGEARTGEESHVDPRAIGGGLGGKRIGGDEAGELVVGAEDDVDGRAHQLLQARGDGGADFGRGAGRVKDGVAALDVGLDVFEAQAFEQLAEVGHGELAGPADIDGAQQGDVGGHTSRV